MSSERVKQVDKPGIHTAITAARSVVEGALPKDNQPGLSRREALRLLLTGGLAGSFLLAACDTGAPKPIEAPYPPASPKPVEPPPPLPAANASPDTRPPLPSPVASPAASPVSGLPVASPSPNPEVRKPAIKERKLVNGNAEVILDDNGTPVKYILLNDGTELPLNQATMQAARQKAISLGEPEIAEVVRYKSREVIMPPYSTKEHPILETPPSDVLPDSELLKLGPRIIKAKTPFYIRKGAFEPGGIFEGFRNNPKKLDIFVMDGDFVSPIFLQPAQRNGDEEKLLIRRIAERTPGKTPDQLKEEHTKYYQQKIEELRATLRQGGLDGGQRASSFDSILSYKRMQHELATMTPRESERYFARTTAKENGLYAPWQLTPQRDRAFMFLPLGDWPEEDPTMQQFNILIAFDEKGKLLLEGRNLSISSGSGGNLDPAKINRDPKATRENNGYPYPTQLTDWMVIHEGMHHVLQSLQNNTSEFDADMAAMAYFQKAWQRWAGSNYQDNSGYNFVIGRPYGGFILV